MPRFAVIDAPSVLGLKPGGVENLPETLILNPDALRTYSLRLAEAVTAVLRQGRFPVVLGGDCSNQTGEVASMDLAVVSGSGPDVVADIDGLRPLVREEDVVAFGFRDVEEQREYGSQDIRATGIHVVDLEQVRALGVTAAAEGALETLQIDKLGGFWTHLDADVLNDESCRRWTTATPVSTGTGQLCAGSPSAWSLGWSRDADGDVTMRFVIPARFASSRSLIATAAVIDVVKFPVCRICEGTWYGDTAGAVAVGGGL